jgi:RNA polymerase sigma-70 factor (ECF subfamily)
MGETYRMYAGLVLGRCRRLLRDDDEALDVTHEAFVRCLRHWTRLRAGPELAGWLTTVATRICLNRLRDRKVAAGRQRAELPPPVEPLSPEAALVRRQLASRLMAALDAETRSIACSVYVDELTHEEAARRAGVCERTVRNRLARAVAEGRAACA